MKSLLIFIVAITSFLTIPIKKECEILTEQFGDKVIYKGKEYVIYDYLMESYFAKHPNKKPKEEISSSALERGYIATYEITNEKLFLIDIEIRKGSLGDNSLSSVYNELFSDEPRKTIDWKTGFLELPHGDIVSKYLVPPIHSNYLVFELKKGKVKELRAYTDSELRNLKNEQLIAFKKTAKYRRLIKCFKKTRIKPFYKNEDMDFYLRKHILKYTDKFLAK